MKERITFTVKMRRGLNAFGRIERDIEPDEEFILLGRSSQYKGFVSITTAEHPYMETFLVPENSLVKHIHN